MTIDELLNQLSLAEKIAFCSGASFWKTKALPRLGIPQLLLSDGPHGLRVQADKTDHLGLQSSLRATCFPTASLLASTWDCQLIEQMGAALGQEARARGVSILLGPGVNMKRNPLNGRNFEYFSEDPLLAGQLAAAWIRGVQSQGVGAALKHFAANNQENRRMTSNSLVDQRALREYYLPAFEIAVKTARPAAVMCAYNRLNGSYCSEDQHLLGDILRGEWGFDGVILTDWAATHDRIAAFKAGLDLEMPGSKGFFDQEVAQAVKQGSLNPALIDASVRRLLTLAQNYSPRGGTELPRTRATAPPGQLRPEQPPASAAPSSSGPDPLEAQAHHQLARQVAAAGAVLLKNQAETLPYQPNQPLLVLGQLAAQPRYQGHGSSLVTPTRVDSLLDGLGHYSSQIHYAQGYRLDGRKAPELLRQAVQQAASWDGQILLCLGLPDVAESEGYDRSSLALPQVQLDLLATVYLHNPRITVVLICGSPVEMPWLPQVRALLQLQLAGQAGGLAAADLLFGSRNPCGKLAESYPISYDDVICRNCWSGPGTQVPYRESLYVGYRYYDSVRRPVQFPFGYGLSYTRFTYSNLTLQPLKQACSFAVTFTLTNSGKRAGAEVVQLYVAPRTGGSFRPAHELKAFSKVYLEPGQQQPVTLTLEPRSFELYQPGVQSWVIEAGSYQIEIGASSRDIRLETSIDLKGQKPLKDNCSDWYYQLQGQPEKVDFVSLYGDYPEWQPPRRGEYDLNSALRDLKHSSPLGGLICGITQLVIAMKTSGKPDWHNARFKMLMLSAQDNTLRSMLLFHPSRFLKKLVAGLLWLTNHPGHHKHQKFS
ncbi:glycosyl hydrolase [Oscillospiraceae bacterium HV4-5-C5C]|nr:glycosyl hydrolase [Oscillospiraceae bacterium HV4-5-C5C]